MSYAAGGAAAQAAIANAIKASGAIIRVSVVDFSTIMHKVEEPLIIQAETKLFKISYKYLTSYKGFVFYTKSSEPLMLPNNALLIKAESVWIPN